MRNQVVLAGWLVCTMAFATMWPAIGISGVLPGAVLAAGGCGGNTTPGMVIHDDNSAESWAGWGQIQSQTFVDLFTPSIHPATYSSACFLFGVPGASMPHNFHIVVYDDDGVGGGPGTLLGSWPASGTWFNDASPSEFLRFDISGLNLDITTGSVYIGASWANPGPSQDNWMFLAMDTTSSTPSAGGWTKNAYDPWAPITNSFADYRALMVRAVERSDAIHAQNAFAPVRVAANQTSMLTITLDNEAIPPAAAVLDRDFTHRLPDPLVVAPTPNAGTTCPSGTVVAPPGGHAVILQSGAGIPAVGSCTVTVDVVASTEASYVDIIPSESLSTQLGDNLDDASATLVVGSGFYCDWSVQHDVAPITHVEFGGFVNNSDNSYNGSPALEDFREVTGFVSAGNATPLDVTLRTSDQFYPPLTTRVAAFIDWNQDGDFDDAAEQFDLGSTPAQQANVDMSGNVPVPITARGGATRMRVVAAGLEHGSAEACGNGHATDGQAEDYTVYVHAEVLFADGFEQ